MSLRRKATVETAYQEIEVWRTAVECEFRVEGAVHAWWHRDRFLTGLAWDNLAAAALLRPAGPPRNLLMLGIAGGTTLRILRHLLPECEFTAVDIDGEVVAVAREHMELDGSGAEIHIADAYRWVAGRKERYDVIIDDCYLAGEGDVYRPERSPERGMKALMGLLAEGGVFATNLVTGSGHRRLQSRTRSAFRRMFPVVRSVTTWDSMNETLVGGDGVLSGGALDRWEEKFEVRKDQEYWRRLEVRLLGRTPSGG